MTKNDDYKRGFVDGWNACQKCIRSSGAIAPKIKVCENYYRADIAEYRCADCHKLLGYDVLQPQD